jgi:probable addiction module antidote protein
MSKAQLYKQAILKEQLKHNPHSVIVYLQNAIDEADSVDEILLAMRTIATARGFSKFAEEADLNRENLYRVLSQNGNPRMDTFLKLIDLLGFKLSLKPK